METIVIGVELDLPQSEIDRLAASTEGIGGFMGEGLEGANAGLEDMATGADSAGGSVRGLSSITRVFSADLGKGAAAVTALTRGVMGFTLSLGPAVIVVGAIVAGLALYRYQAERVAAANKAAEERTNAMTRAMEGQISVSMSLRDDMRLLNGSIDEGGLAVERRKARVQAASDEIVAAFDAQIAAQEALILSEQKDTQVSDTQQAVVAGLEETLDLLEDERAAELANLDIRLASVDKIAKEKQAREDLAERARQQAKAAAIARARNARELAEQEALRIAGLQRVFGMIQSVAAIEEQAAESTRTAEESILSVYHDRIAALDAIAGKGIAEADVAAARGAVEMAMEEELFQLRERNREELATERERDHNDRMAEIEMQAAAQASAISDAGSILGSFSQLAKQAADERSKHDAKAAKRALGISKALAIAESTAQFAAGIVTAAAKSGGNPIVTALRVGALTAVYGTQVAAISATKLHGGGFPDEVDTRLTRNEAVISPLGRDTLGDQTIRDANAGKGSAPPTMRIVQQYRHESFNDFINDGLKMGNPVSDRIASNALNRTGQRTNRRGAS